MRAFPIACSRDRQCQDFSAGNRVAQYHEQGFVAPVDVMSEDEADAYLQRLQAAEAEYPDDLNAENRNNPHLAFSFLDELVHHPLILDAVEDLIGVSFSLWGSVLFIKEPQSKHYVSWHQDATYMGIEPQNFVTPWLALSREQPRDGLYEHDSRQPQGCRSTGTKKPSTKTIS